MDKQQFVDKGSQKIFYHSVAAWALIFLSGFDGAAQQALPKKNVLFIFVDDLKPVLNCYGESQIVSPNIDALAQQGVVFSNAYCQWPVSGPSRASILTGLTPDGTGVRNLSTLLREVKPNVVTLPQYFKSKGYATAACGKVFDPRNVDEGHDLSSWSIPYVDPKQYSYPHQYGAFVDGNQYRVAPNTATEQGPSGVDDDGYTDGQICNDALGKLNSLAQNPNQPFFLAVGFKKPHIPFIAPDKYWKLYDRSLIQLAPYQRKALNSPDYAYSKPEPIGYSDIPNPWEYDDVELGDGILDPAVQKRLIHGYYACVSYIDAQIGKLMSQLERYNLKDKTIVVLIGDHGYHLGDHNLWGKHTQFENALRAPLIIVDPDGVKGTHPNSVEFTDVFPTVCELAGVDVPVGSIQGVSLKPVVQGGNPVAKLSVSEYRAGGGSAYSFRNDRYRLTLWMKSANDRPDRMVWLADQIKMVELYDYQVDPLETNNVAGQESYRLIKNMLLDEVARWWNGQYRFFSGIPSGIPNQSLEPDFVMFDRQAKVLEIKNPQVIRINIYDLTGNMVLTAPYLNHVIDVSGFQPGLYLCQIFLGNQCFVQKVMIQ